MKRLAPSAHFTCKNRSMRAFTLPELAVVIVVLAILIAASYFGFSTWRDRVAETELKSDLTGVAAAMDSARNWSKGYPELTDGVTFDGGEATKAIFTQSEHVILTYYEGDAKNYCIDAVSKARPSIAMFYSNTVADGEKGPVKGTCMGGEGATPPPAGSEWTQIVYDLNAPGCTTMTMALPIRQPSSISGAVAQWGDGSQTSVTNSFAAHTYSEKKKYLVSYNGPITQLEVDSSSRQCIKELKKWGSNAQPTKVTFKYASNLTYVAEPPHTVTDMSEMFARATSFNQPIGDWDVSNVTDMHSMFESQYGSPVPFNQSINNWNVGNVTDMSYMFYYSTTFNQPLNNWNVSKVTNLRYMFSGATAFNQSLNSWNTGNVTNMSGVFNGATAFNQPVNNWNVGKATDMSQLFQDSAFNQPLTGWNTSSATNMSQMFMRANTFNQSLSHFDTSKVTNMNGMFYQTQFNQPINNWDVSKVTNMNSMFYSTPFNQLLTNWNTGSVTDMSYMFAWMNYNQPLNNWNVSNVTNMNSMFDTNSTFNQPLNSWNTSKVTSMNRMFISALNYNQNLSSWNVSLVTPKPPTNFAYNASAWTLPKPVW